MTKLLYLEDQNLDIATATILDIIETEENLNLVLGQTIFYVQGGGQPGDIGIIKNKNGNFIVSNTNKNETGMILHHGKFEYGKFEIGDQVELLIDKPTRQLNSKIHSAGHLIDLAIENLDLTWTPTKGYHFPNGPYVEYQLNDESVLDLEQLKTQIQIEFDKLVEAKLLIKIKLDETKSYNGQKVRIVSFDDICPCPCGGTHVENTSDLLGFWIRKIKVKNGVAKISYGLE